MRKSFVEQKQSIISEKQLVVFLLKEKTINCFQKTIDYFT